MHESPYCATIKVLACLTMSFTLFADAGAAPTRVYFGTFSGKGSASEGIYTVMLDPATGALTQPQVAAREDGASFLALHPNKRFLYTVCTTAGADGKREGAVAAYRIDPATGNLDLLNRQSSEGQGPCYVSVDQTGRCALVANYGSGGVAALPVAEDGSLRKAKAVIQHEGSSVNPKRQTGPHAHCILPDPENRFAYAPDLGIDKALIYRLDPAAAMLEPAGAGILAPGAGPRQIAFHPSGRFAYVINELGSTITAFTRDTDSGALTEIRSVSTLPPDFTGPNTTAAIRVHPTGRFLYGSNRGHDTIAVFSVDPEKGSLRFVEWESIRGKAPRDFGIDPSGAWLLAAGQDSDTVAVFRIDPAKGSLEFSGNEIKVPRPVCVLFLPSAP